MFSNMLMSNKVVAPPSGFDYAAYAGYALHWDASAMVPLADAKPIASIADLSGTGNDGAQPTVALQPLYKTNIQNGLPIMRFDGVDDKMLFPAHLTPIRTVFWVLNCDPLATGFRTLLGDTAVSTDFFRGNSNAFWRSGSADANVTNGVTKMNGATVANPLVTIPPTGQFGVVSLATAGITTANNFGAERYVSGRYFWGDLAELLIYTSALSAADVSTVEAHLKAKWGTP